MVGRCPNCGARAFVWDAWGGPRYGCCRACGWFPGKAAEEGYQEGGEDDGEGQGDLCRSK